MPGAAGTDSYGAVNSLNQYPSIVFAAGGSHAMAYDLKGNLTAYGPWSYTYDAENRLLTASKTGSTNSYAYDPLGRRVKKTASGTVTYFLVDGDDEIAEYSGTGSLLRRFIPGPAVDQPVSMQQGAVQTFFHTDKHGSTVAMSDATGKLAEGPYT